MRVAPFLLVGILVLAIILAASYAMGRYLMQPWRRRPSITRHIARERDWRYRRR